MAIYLLSLLSVSILITHCWSLGVPDEILDKMWDNARSYQFSELHQYLDNYHRSLSSLQPNAVELWVFEPHNEGWIASAAAHELDNVGKALKAAVDTDDARKIKHALHNEKKTHRRVLHEKQELLEELRAAAVEDTPFTEWNEAWHAVNQEKESKHANGASIKTSVENNDLIGKQRKLVAALRKASESDIRPESHSTKLGHIGYIKSKNKQFIDNQMVYEVHLTGDQYYRGRMLTSAHFRHQNEEPKAWYFTSMTTPNENQGLNWHGKLKHWDAHNSKPNHDQLWDLVGVFPVEY